MFSRLLLKLRALWLHRLAKVGIDFERSLPFADYIVDLWEKAERLGFGERVSIYDSILVISAVKVGKNTWIGQFVVLDGSAGIEISAYCSIFMCEDMVVVQPNGR